MFGADGNIHGDPGGVVRAQANAALDCINSTWARNEPKNETMRQGKNLFYFLVKSKFNTSRRFTLQMS